MSDVYRGLCALTPYDLVGKGKIRIGARHDGGYVAVDHLRATQDVFSYGISDEVSFDLQMAERGHRVFMFDHTIEKPPLEHDRFRFVREGVAGISAPDRSLFSLQHHVEQLAEDRTDLILKMDVEGAEWEVFRLTPDSVLRRFEQILIEVHNLETLADPARSQAIIEALDALNRNFILCHAHANNCGALSVADGFVVADALELTYIRNDLAEPVTSTTTYPTPHDAPNSPLLPDYLLWFFPFAPKNPALPSRLMECLPPPVVRPAGAMLQTDRTFAFGEPYGAARAGLLHGWEPPEPWGVWSSGPQASLVYMIEGFEERTCHVEIDLWPFSPVGLTQSVRIRSGDRLCGEASFDHQQFWHRSATVSLADVPLQPAGGGAILSLTFEVGHPASPASLNINKHDGRLLGVGLTSIRVYRPA